MQETYGSPDFTDELRLAASGAIAALQETNMKPKTIKQARHVARQHGWTIAFGPQPKHGPGGLAIMAHKGRMPTITGPKEQDFADAYQAGKLARSTVALSPGHLIPIYLVYGYTGRS